MHDASGSSKLAAAVGADLLPAHRPPAWWLTLMEGRAPWEYMAMLAAMPWLRRLPQGDGHPVIVYPGLAANDLATYPLRSFLGERGYTAHPWGQGMNFGPRAGVLEACGAQLCHLAQQHGGRVSLVGWSLGGVFARELARRHPLQVRCVITLGAPFAGPARAASAWRLYEWVSGQSVEDDETSQRTRRAPPVPTTSIYSRTDGVVAWQCSLNEDAPLCENIEVHASHMGMGMNPVALYAVVDRLAQDPARWRRFDVRGARRWFYQTQPARLTAAGRA